MTTMKVMENINLRARIIQPLSDRLFCLILESASASVPIDDPYPHPRILNRLKGESYLSDVNKDGRNLLINQFGGVKYGSSYLH
jgi:hypothetical protein